MIWCGDIIDSPHKSLEPLHDLGGITDAISTILYIHYPNMIWGALLTSSAPNGVSRVLGLHPPSTHPSDANIPCWCSSSWSYEGAVGPFPVSTASTSLSCSCRGSSDSVRALSSSVACSRCNHEILIQSGTNNQRRGRKFYVFKLPNEFLYC